MSIITISRGTFSGGKDLAESLARSLGYPCISREVIVEAAERYGTSEAALSLALNHAPSLIDRLKRDRDHYLAYIRAVLCRHALEGDFIYHGYAGHHLLAGVHHMIRVRIVANLAYRISAAMKELQMTSRQAGAHINKVDDERRKWTRFLYGVTWEDPMNYDVVLNLEHLGVKGACAVVECMTRLEQFQATAESRKVLEDFALQSFVIAALARDERTGETDFVVHAENGVVTIDGMANLPDMVASVNEVAGKVEGVVKVVNQVVTFGIPA
jgi:cytidylate kinase